MSFDPRFQRGRRRRRGLCAWCLALIAGLGGFVASVVDAQSMPPTIFGPTVWVSAGGAIGEATHVTLDSVAPGSTYVMAASGTKAGPVLGAPIVQFGFGNVTTLNPTVDSFFVPSIPALVGHTVHVQAAGVAGTMGWRSNVASWALAPNPSPRFVATPLVGGSGTACILSSGDVLFCGGAPLNGPYYDTAYLLDMTTRTGTAVGTMSTGRSNVAWASFRDGSMIVCGGEATSVSFIDRYDPTSRMFTRVAALPKRYGLPIATSFSDLGGREFALILGGTVGSTRTRDAFVYDPRLRTVSSVALTQPLDDPTLTAFPGAVLISGGRGTNGMPVPDVELYVHALNRSVPWGRMRQPRFGHGALVLDGRHALFVGGHDGAARLKTFEVFDVLGRVSSLLPFTLHGAYGPTAVARLADGSAIVAGRERIDAFGATPLRPIPHPPGRRLFARWAFIPVSPRPLYIAEDAVFEFSPR